MRDKFMRFMIGRYGTDEYSKFLIGLGLALMIVNMFLRIGLINFIVLALLVYVYVRMFSKNIQARYAENQKYLVLKNKCFSIFRKEQRMMQDRKTNHIYTCPNCRQKIRIPRGKGKICITCPKCRTEFVKKS